MSPQKSHQSHNMRTSRKPAQAGREPRIGTRISASLLIFLLSASLAYGVGPIGTPTPPLPPQVPPIISGDYSTDLNGNRIDDALEAGPRTQGDLSIASAEEGVAVELVFKEPITQHQINEFLRLGGQITYIYKAISYGWNGRIPRENIGSLPSAMGPTLVQVESIQRLRAYMDTATQVARVRPIWKAGFAGNPSGFSGDPNTTIGFIGSGVDAKHADLRGRCVYWHDFSDDNEPTPVDFDGHESMVVGVAAGTGAASGASAGALHYTFVGYWPDYLHMADPIWLPAGTVTIKSQAFWTGGTATLDHFGWTRGTAGTGMNEMASRSKGSSPQVLTNTFTASGLDVISVVLADFDNQKNLDNVVIVNTVSPYPGVGDGFNKLRGVAPGCQWAAAKVTNRDGYAESDKFTAAVDDLVLHRTEMNIKVMNMSFGLEDALGLPQESTSLRDKVNSVVKNGIIVVAAAGNNASGSSEAWRKMADPARAAQAITVGATNDENALTTYSSYGFFSPRTNSGEDFKPDLVAPGGSIYYTGIMSVDSGSSDGVNADKEPNDYASSTGTSFSAPFVAGSAALVIQAMERQGIKWKFNSSDQPKYVKMLLCATASETNANREGTDKGQNPTLQRVSAGPNAFPPGKDQHEGYGIINPDAAVEAVSLVYTAGSTVSADLGGNAAAKRVWARTINLKAGCDVDFKLDNPAAIDADLYLYSPTPSDTGTPVILASSTATGAGAAEAIHFLPAADMTALLVIKRISGAGTVTLRSVQAGPPTAVDVQAACAMNASTTITLKATDDGRPIPPGALSYTIVSLPAQGKLEIPGGAAIGTVPAKLPADKVVYKPAADWLGDDTFTFLADDGGTAPFGGKSNTATVKVTVVKEVTIECSVLDSADDVCAGLDAPTEQTLTEKYLYIGSHAVGLRFRTVKIPQGAVIKRASLKVFSVSSYWATANVDGFLKGEAADNPAPFGTDTRIVTQLATTHAATDWKWTSANTWKASVWYESPDITAIVQEIVNRPKWASDNALVILYLMNSPSDSDRAFYAFDCGNPAAAARLVITYQPK
jgi:subtilisin family serine protease